MGNPGDAGRFVPLKIFCSVTKIEALAKFGLTNCRPISMIMWRFPGKFGIEPSGEFRKSLVCAI